VAGAEVLFLTLVASTAVALVSILRRERRKQAARPMYVTLAIFLVVGFCGWLVVGAVITSLTHPA
jgi:hypothetical protein